MTLSAIELQSRFSASIMRGLTAGLYANITDAMFTTLATAAASAVSAILAVVPGGAPNALEFRAELVATIFSALATGTSTINDGVLTSITGSQITSLASTSVSCVAAVQSAVNANLTGWNQQAVALQSRTAVQAFAGLASGLLNITGSQITAIATLAADAAAAIQAAA